MRQPPGKARARYVRDMFGHIAGQYDRMNRWMTWGQDTKWRRKVIRLACLPPNGRMLDIGTGTGDLAMLGAQKDETSSIVGADLTSEMIQVARTRHHSNLVSWVITDALDLPFNSCTFDAVVSGFLLRNVVDIDQAIGEQYRVLKPGGHMVCLETTPPGNDWRHLPMRLYMKHVIPFLGNLIAGNREAYTYLPNTTRQFLPVEQLEEHMLRAGFQGVTHQRYMGGTVAIHGGTK